MNLDELRSVQAKERRKDSLQHLRDSFYDDVASYIADLRAARNRRAEQVDDPFSDDDVRRMSDEIETAEEVSEALYERRVGKVVKLASFAAADMPVERDGMTSQERALFEDLVSRIEQNKSSVLDVLAGDVEHGSGDESAEPAASDQGHTEPTDPSTPRTADSVPEQAPDSDSERSTGDEHRPGPDESTDSGMLAEAMGGEDGPEEAGGSDSNRSSTTGHTPVEPEPAPPAAEPVDGGADSEADAIPEDGTGSAAPDEPERMTVRITRNVGEILGVDEREYELTTEDVVTLPEANAEPLVQRDAAERID